MEDEDGNESGGECGSCSAERHELPRGSLLRAPASCDPAGEWPFAADTINSCQSKLSGGIGVPSAPFPLMALFLNERSTPPPEVPTPVALPEPVFCTAIVYVTRSPGASVVAESGLAVFVAWMLQDLIVPYLARIESAEQRHESWLYWYDTDWIAALLALVAVLLLGILKGVLLAVIVSILMLLARAARPHVAFLGRIPGTRRFSDLGRNPDNETVPGLGTISKMPTACQ